MKQIEFNKPISSISEMSGVFDNNSTQLNSSYALNSELTLGGSDIISGKKPTGSSMEIISPIKG